LIYAVDQQSVVVSICEIYRKKPSLSWRVYAAIVGHWSVGVSEKIPYFIDGLPASAYPITLIKHDSASFFRV
jgi:hypothetical protein